MFSQKEYESKKELIARIRNNFEENKDMGSSFNPVPEFNKRERRRKKINSIKHLLE